ncbi:MAG: glycerophosphoryl diester phosphodiesterase membrane domain-containing protein [Candidatus Dormibacteria bacterium]
MPPPVPGSGRFRGRTFGELLDGSFATYRRGFVVFFVCIAAVAVPYRLLTIGQSIDAFRIVGGAGSGSAARGLDSSLLTLLVSLMYSILVLPFGAAAVVRGVADTYMEREMSLGGCLRALRRRVAAVALLNLLSGLIIVVPLGLLILLALNGAADLVGLLEIVGFGYYVTVFPRLQLALAVVILENASATEALRRSWQLSRGSYWRIVGLIVVIGIGEFLAGSIILIGFALFTGGVGSIAAATIAASATALISIFFAALPGVAMTLLYHDVRIRREGWDIEMLAQTL